jgi:predicted metal-dependent phosphoesterase TrpH
MIRVERLADLHTHTTHSDGALTPAELIGRAASAGISTISIADHDSVSAIDEATAEGSRAGVEVIPGMELSAVSEEGEVHILGYFVDHRDEALLAELESFRLRRLERIERIVGKLNSMKIPLTVESVLAEASGDSIGRPHVASALVAGGHTETYQQAFNKYLANGRPAYERKDDYAPEEAIRLIADAGGLSFLAHPSRSVDDAYLRRLIGMGLDGIEVYHPSHPPDLVRHYKGIVNEYFLLESGGSDFHGGRRGDDDNLGMFGIPAQGVEMMRRRLRGS